MKNIENRVNVMLGANMVLREAVIALIATHQDKEALMAEVLARATTLRDLSVSQPLPEATLRGIEAEAALLRARMK